jgi:hypothetical protein
MGMGVTKGVIFYSKSSEFIRVCAVPYLTVPYRFPRGTVLVDRAAYRTFLTVFRVLAYKREFYRDLNIIVLPF